MAANNVSFVLALTAGLVSFLSPCVLPLVPTYLAYLAGGSLAELTGREMADPRLRYRMLTNAMAFVLGFSLVFVSLGLSASLIGTFLLRYQQLLRQLGGLVVIVFGLHTMGLLKLSYLYREKKVEYRPRRSSILSSFLIGMAFSAGWTPCVGPILSTILLYASLSETAVFGGLLLATYSLGLAIPFMLSAVFLGFFLRYLGRFTPHLPKVNLVAGMLMVGIGILLYGNYFFRLAQLFNFGW
ncbi:MAG: cytochrome c biogenesis CcdA family protein [Firmicutes bacterium]|nr:cytochrome c biogenesis CcdA family protein [Bacillota bacterium]